MVRRRPNKNSKTNHTRKKYSKYLRWGLLILALLASVFILPSAKVTDEDKELFDTKKDLFGQDSTVTPLASLAYEPKCFSPSTSKVQSALADTLARAKCAQFSGISPGQRNQVSEVSRVKLKQLPDGTHVRKETQLRRGQKTFCNFWFAEDASGNLDSSGVRLAIDKPEQERQTTTSLNSVAGRLLTLWETGSKKVVHAGIDDIATMQVPLSGGCVAGNHIKDRKEYEREAGEKCGVDVTRPGA